MTFAYQIGAGSEQRRALAGDTLTIGRARTCDIVVDRDGVEPEHCRLTRRAGGWHVEDNRTRTGTVILRGGGPRAEIVLPAGRSLAAGDHLLIGHERQPHFRGWFVAAAGTGAGTGSGSGTGSDSGTGSGTATATVARAAAIDELAAVRTELAALRLTLAEALRDRDAHAAAHDRAQSERDRHAAQTLHDHTQEVRALAAQITVRDAERTALRRELAAAEAARTEAVEAAHHERGERERALAITAQLMANANASGLLARQRAIVAEALSGQVAELEAQVGERDRLIANLEAQLARRHSP